MNIPKHIAIIPDGNRRWAKKKNLSPSQGHQRGAETAELITREAIKLGIPHITAWGSSYDNLTKRPIYEIKILNKLYKEFADRLAKDKDIIKHEVKVTFLGEWKDLLEPYVIDAFKNTEYKTKKYNKHFLTCLIGYNGDREMIAAIKSLRKSDDPVTNDSIKKHLWTSALPSVDLLIRTGNEPHLSTGFMMWNIKYAELYFSNKLWPDFTVADLKKAIKYYATRERRYGK
ncbi:MAG TPA: polyprenyl diphosphate synthase [Candidatus Paceibacterota bacterium]